ncbi:MAG: glycosyl hydrolase 53 family protein [Anaerolineae bacterium]|nr:glycosyl hydrolase 53 family protein [Phycisphaerae bacterium]
MKQSRVGSITLSLAALGLCSAAPADPFYMGGDISLLPFIESRGGTFRDAGQVRPMEQIMTNHGANMFRLRLFVNPNTNYSATSGAIQDLNYTIALAQRLQASGAEILLDLH